MIRAFVAVKLSAELRDVLDRLQTALRRELARTLKVSAPDARLQWVKPASIHLTLKFLGDVEESRVPAIEQTLRAIASAHTSFAVSVQGLGVFPDARAPRVLWVGLKGGGPTGDIVGLAGDVDRSLATLGFEPEGRPFSPHLTLARIKERSREIGKALNETGILAAREPLGSLSVHFITLMRSQLNPGGAIYTPLAVVPLAGVNQ